MKTGLLLLQSIASSSLRSDPRRGDSFIAAAGAFGLAGLLGGVGAGRNRNTSTTAMCSDKDDHQVTPATSVAIAAVARNKSRGFFERGKVDHNLLLPFPETSLKHDTYDGVTLDITTLISLPHHALTLADANAFGNLLGKALEIWTKTGRKGIWIKIPTSHSHLIAPACSLHGFDFQHAESGFCVLTKWLPKGTASRLPNGPTHQVGIGALVIHPVTGKMLAVQERSGPAARAKLWKMPTGLTDPGEDIAVASVRELKEETGLDCVFDRILCIRQAHGGLFGRSDMFCVCLCKLAPEYEQRLKEGGEIDLVPQEEEILMADWIDFDSYTNQGLWKGSPLYEEMNQAMMRAIENSNDDTHGFVAKNLEVGFRPGRNTIYVSSKL